MMPPPQITTPLPANQDYELETGTDIDVAATTFSLGELDSAKQPGAGADDTVGVAHPLDAEFDSSGTADFSVSKAIKYSVASLGSQAVFTLFNLGMPLYLEAYNTSPWLIGLLANERSLVGSFIQPIVGRLSDRTRTRLGRRRPFFLAGVPLTCLSLLALGLHPPFWVMLAVMSVAAFFLSIAMDPYLALMADVFPRGHRGRVGGFTGLASAAGTVVFLLLAALFWERAEFAVFALVALTLAAGFAVTFVSVKEPALAQIQGRVQAGAEMAANLPTARKASLAQRISKAVPGLREYKEARKYILAVVLFWGGGGGVAPFLTLFAKHSLGADSGSAFLLPVGYVASSLLFVLPAGYMADRVGKKRVLTTGLALYAVGALAGSQATGIAQGVGAMALLGVANACTSVLIPLLTDLIPADRCAEIVGIASALWSFAQPVGSVLAGLVVNAAAGVADLNVAYRLVFMLAGLLIGVSAIMLQRVRTSPPSG